MGKIKKVNDMKRNMLISAAGILALALSAPAHASETAQTAVETAIGSESVKRIKDTIAQLRADGYSCSQATLLGICKVLGSDLTDAQLKALTSGLRGGVGRTFGDGTCGALTAGSMALGLYTAYDDEKAVTLSKELFDHFKKEYGTVKCGDIVSEFKFTKCTGCCLCIGEKVAEILQREQASSTQALSISWDDANKTTGI